jgi:hypothetical protein
MAQPIGDVFLGILSASFGDGDTRQDFAEAAERWQGIGGPWVMFYFDDGPKQLTKSRQIAAYLEVCQCRESLEPLKIVHGYCGVRGREGAFYEKVREHLCHLIHVVAPLPLGTPRVPPPRDPTKYLHCDELLAAVRGRVQIRRMARNPVMLTALAVVHWNERRLPEQRADLYDSIITWLSRSREQRAGRETADRTVVLLQELALAMQDDPEGRKTQVSKRWGAEKIAAELAGAPVTKDTVAAAERFLDEEEVDSGIIVGRGNQLAYWHLTFQEFLAAKAIASRLDDQQRQILLSDPNKIYLPDWREVVLLYAGALHQQGKAKVAGFLGGLLDRLGPSPSLADQARCAGLIGSILQDLAPLKFEFPDTRYHGLLDAVTTIFDRERCQAVPLAERIAAADALGQAGDARIDLRREGYWVTIPAGKFLMGAQSDDPQSANYDPESTYTDQLRETPHEVSLDAYGIARYPVTVGQYLQFVEDEGYQEERWWGCSPAFPGGVPSAVAADVAEADGTASEARPVRP